MSICDQILDSRSDWLQRNTGKPQKVFLNIKGMHDLYEFIEDHVVQLYAISSGEKPEIFGLEICFDPLAMFPRVE